MEQAQQTRHIVPEVEEHPVIQTREVPGDTVHVRKIDRTEERNLRIPVTTEHIDVQRVPVGAEVDGPVAPWHDGDTLVVPVMEQVPVVHTQWVVREEIRITRSPRRDHRDYPVRLKREEAVVERTSPSGEPAAPAGGRHNTHERRWP